jgi:hypothetical protein
MIIKKEIIGLLLLFSIIYLIIYIDHKLHTKCDCNNCYISSNQVSIKIPLLVSMIGFIIYKLSEPYIISYMCEFSIVKQDIITEMADF